MRKLSVAIAIILMAALFLAGCQNGQRSEYRKYTDSFFDTLWFLPRTGMSVPMER